MRYSYGITAALLAGGATISLITGYPAGAQVAQNDAAQIERVVPRAGAPASFADLTAQLQPAVVNISTKQRVTVNNNPFAGSPLAELFGNGGGQPTTRQATSLGSGFLISADGYIVTNNHVIQPDGRAQLESVTVKLVDGTEFPAEVVGRDPQSDLAVLKIKRDQPFPFVHFGDSSTARVGDWVIAIGNPFGLQGTVTSGIVSAVQRHSGMGGAYDRYIQTDASINQGNSGGPLFDMAGNVIGINNAILSPSGGSVGIGLAIPAETAKPIVEKLVAGEEILRGYLGVRIQPLNEDFAAALGVPVNRGELIQSVQPGEAGEKAGLQANDLVLKVDGKEVTPEQNLSFLVANVAPGTRIPLEIIRDGRRQTIQVVVGRRPSDEELAAQNFDPNAEEGSSPAPTQGGQMAQDLGLQAIPINAQIARQLGLTDGTTGLVVTAVDPNGDAATKGIQRGTIITSANGKSLRTVADLEAAISAARGEGREAILLRVRAARGPEVTIAVRLSARK
ncbi:PDZ domain-containing protein [Altererythrobacter xixiisoli]|uniref:Probable periplasmic serine endoprotease DegP-like n=1 Tax=Croceibacterium xixiisoli TaxID=1476466 RepID=A0A6I4TW55_9SPHN|nr:trypsin-like peptidase domain-containing protein [Croceibacterium xixiisoli]MXP00287.1 PDZ domain-containing protein [Croceibacterium xixiisoli]